jgi:predicted DNA-binding protein
MFPVRLEHSLMNELNRISKETKINKTTISRIAIEKMIKELQTTGVAESLKNTFAV